MSAQKPNIALLKKWRLLLISSALPLAFFNALFFTPGSTPWTVISCGWVLCFLFFYLLYFPIRFARLSFRLTGKDISMISGVFMNRQRIIPLDSIQFTTHRTSLLDNIWGISSVAVTAAGGRLVLPGLLAKDAQSLCAVLTDEHPSL